VIVEKGYAKINLGLEVLEKRPDNYHELSMIMTTIDLYDELYFADIESNICIIDYDKPNNLNIENDLIYKAYLLLKKKYHIDKGLKVKVVKRIPEQAGLGGGSADAAATLRALNQLWELHLSLDDLAQLGFQIGSDIPFCIYNKTAKVSGRGEVVEFIEECPYINLVLVFPDFKSSTADIFSSFRIHFLNKGKIKLLEQAIIDNEIQKISETIFNDLEHAKHYSEINSIKDALIYSGALGSAMTGSGSTVYGICYSKKHAKTVINNFFKLNEESKQRPFQKYKTLITATRSFRRSNPVRFDPDDSNTSNKGKTISTCEGKAYGMINLFYRRIMEHYQLITTPISLYDNIHIEKTDGAGAAVYFDDVLDSSALSYSLKKISEVVGYGLRVKIKRNIDQKLNLISKENYLSAIICALVDFGEESDKLYHNFDKTVQIHRDYHTVLFNSKNQEIIILNDAIFSYLALIPFNIDNYHPPRYTKQIDDDSSKLESVLTAIYEKNFYKMANSIYNGVGHFDARKINYLKGFNICKKIEEISINMRAGGFVIADGGQYAIALFRLKKNADRFISWLQRKFGLKGFVTSLKSEVVHQPYKSFYLKTEPEIEVRDGVFVEPDDYNPFGDYVSETDFEWFEPERIKTKSPYRKKGKTPDASKEADFEGILYLHSGGSIFKQYDFIDIAYYFQKYFHNKHIRFIIDGNEIAIRFDVANLPHILGMHYLDSTIQGKLGFEKLNKGEISYGFLKKSSQAQKALKEITERTHSSVLILNDIIHNRLYNICCFDRSIILRGNSKNEKFEYGVTRMLTSTMFRRQNLLGIGKDPVTSKYFFQTSYIWNVPADIGKKDSLTISISR